MRKLFYLLILIVMVNPVFSQNYDWKLVDKLIKGQKVQDARKLVEKYHKTAFRAGDCQTLIRSYLYLTKIYYMYREEPLKDGIELIEKDLPRLKQPCKAVAQGLLARYYYRYYQQNSFAILDRTYIPRQEKPLDEWAVEDFAVKCNELLNKSLSARDQLLKFRVKDFPQLFEQGNLPVELRPTMFDFIAYWAIEFYTDYVFTLTRPQKRFVVNNPDYFLPAAKFATLDISSPDTLDFSFKVLKIYQQLLQVHLKGGKTSLALTDADINRILFVYDKYKGKDKDNLYEKALTDIISTYKNWRTGLAKYYLADFYAKKAGENKSQAKDYYGKSLKLIDEILSEAADKQAVALAQKLKSDILRKDLKINSEAYVLPQTDFPVLITYQNLNGPVYLRVYHYGDEYYKLNGKQLFAVLKSEKYLKQYEFQLPAADDYLVHHTEFILPGLPEGEYVLVLSAKPSFTEEQNIITAANIRVTRLAVFGQAFYKNYHLWITDRETGKPLEGLKVRVESYGNIVRGKTATYTTDKQGKIVIPLTDDWANYIITVRKGSDELTMRFNRYSDSYLEPQSNTRLKFFLDRKIYRPGQTVYFKALLYKDGAANDIEVLPGRDIELKFYDANGKLVETRKFRTNDYGTFAGEFVIPQTGLTGNWRIDGNYGGIGFKVEEYKRPQFKVEFNPITGIIAPESKVTVKGKALNYNGLPVSNASVRYTVKRQKLTIWWWFWRPESGKQIVASGHTKTGENGEFSINFSTLPVENSSDVYVYFVEAKVTDINGETHSATTSFRVSQQSIFLSLKGSGKVKLGHSADFEVLAKNILDRELKDLDISYRIVLLKPYKDYPLTKRLWQDPDKYAYTEKQWYERLPYMAYKNEMADYENWQEDKVIAQGTVRSSGTIGFKPGKTGIYKVVVFVKDPATGQQVEAYQIVKAYDEGKQALAPLPLYAFAINDTVQPGEKAKLIVGSGWKDARALVQVTYNNRIVLERFLKLSQSQEVVEFDVTPGMRGDVGVNIVLVHDNRNFYKNIRIVVPYPSKKLDVRTVHFTDKLQPGQQETWSFVITKQNGEKALAEVLASMYDASLDAFAPNKWEFGLARPKNNLMGFTEFFVEKLARRPINITGFDAWVNVPRFGYYKFNWYGLNFYPQYPRYKLPKRPKAGIITPLAFAAEQAGVRQAAEDTQALTGEPEQPGISGQEPQIRSDFAETAFFYPGLTTNENGEVVISFKVPESLTAWNFQLFAHDRQLNFGLYSAQVTTSKDLMIFPNQPRFVRQGDTLQFSIKVSNNSDQALDVPVSLEMKNARTGEVLSILTPKGKQNVHLAPGESKAVSWTVIVPGRLTDPLVYTAIAEAGKFSDGQRDIIPVLSNRILVTETVPLPVNGLQTRTFTIDKLWKKSSNSIEPYKLTFEFNSNPVWYAITALPYMMEYPYECNEQLFARLYSNALASYIVNSDPDIKRVFEIWKKTQSQALVSELEKKQELKQIVLDATPWLLEGQSETEARQRIALLFDLNKMAYEQQRALDKLLKGQNSDGGWPWFKGGRSSWFVTQYILTGFARLQEKGVFNTGQIREKLNRAVRFTDQQVREYYKKLTEYNTPEQMNKNHLSPLIVQWLYMRSFYQNEPVSRGKSDTVFDYFYGQLKKYWTSLNLYSQAQAAIALHRWGDEKLAREIIEAFRQRALTDDELGTYWAANKPGWFWYQAPIETQAMIIEAFDKLTTDTSIVESAKRWLLKQKQTTHWATTKATTEAVWALVFTGYNWLGGKQPVQIKMGHTTLPGPGDKIEAATGYFQKIWTAGQITPDMGKITIKNPNRHPAWGAVYYQYFEDIDKVGQWNTNLKIRRELYVEVKDENGTHLQPVTETTPIHTGDVVVVRLVIETDRDMDFVHIKDLRPSGFEPVEQLSGYRWSGGLGYYQSIRDASANFFVDHLSRGKYVFEYRLYATMSGKLSGGLTTIQCMYAPEFAAHSKGQRVEVR